MSSNINEIKNDKRHRDKRHRNSSCDLKNNLLHEYEEDEIVYDKIESSHKQSLQMKLKEIKMTLTEIELREP